MAQEIDKFVGSCPAINSKNLHEFESGLAQEVKLSKRLLASRTKAAPGELGRNGPSAVNLSSNIASPGGGTGIRQGSQRPLLARNKTTQMANGQFQLPNIHSHAALGNRSVDHQRNSLRAN